MNKNVPLILTLLLASLAGTAVADPGMKPGLWELRVTKSIVDGHDTSAQMADMSAKMSEQLAKLTPEQRAQIDAMMGKGGMALGRPPGGGGGVRMCISPEMAKREVPVAAREDGCQPMNPRRSGNRMSYELNCTANGTKTTGTGESTLQGDNVLNRSDITVVQHGESHRIQSESEMRFIGSDCGDVKPFAVPKRP